MGRMRFGVARALEDEADLILKKGLVSHPVQDRTYLTPAMESHRRKREIMVESGIPDVTLRRGVSGRSINPSKPHLNARDGISQPAMKMAPSRSTSSLTDFLDSQFG